MIVYMEKNKKINKNIIKIKSVLRLSEFITHPSSHLPKAQQEKPKVSMTLNQVRRCHYHRGLGILIT